MNLKLLVAQSIRRLCVGCVRLQKLDMRRIAFLVILAVFGSVSVLFFQNFTAPPPPPAPPANFASKPNYKFLSYDGYVIPYIPRGNPRPISPQVAAQNDLMRKAANIASTQLITGDQSCKTVAITYKDKDPRTNLAVRTFTLICGARQVITLNDVFDRGPQGSPNPVAQLMVKSPLKIANSQAATR